MVRSPMDLSRKSERAHKKRIWSWANYWILRMQLVYFLGGKCKICGEQNIDLLEIHHTIPHENGGYKKFHGNEIMNEWKRMLTGSVKAELLCQNCHLHLHATEMKFQDTRDVPP